MKYQFGGKDRWCCVGFSLLLSALIANLFYKSVWGMLVLPIAYIMTKKRWIQKKEAERKQEIAQEFKDAMQVVTTSLVAGYSMENAWREAEKELLERYGEHALVGKEFEKMNASVRLNMPLEQLLLSFAKESGVEDIVTFAEVFSFAKRGGGDFVRIIGTTTRHMRDKVEIMQEIDTVIAAKKMEQKIMNVVPLGILFYFNMASPDFLAVVYGNLLGVVVMTVSLTAYVGAFKLAERVLEIEV